MKLQKIWAILLVAILISSISLMAACGDDDETAEPTKTTQPPVKDVTIKIGLLTDKTGPSAEALIAVDAALADVVRYFNENDLIPGAKVEVIEYDTSYDPSKDIPGYELLKSKGVHVICNGVPSAAITCKPRADQDKMVMFSLTAALPMYTPPGYVFCTDTPTDAIMYTMLDWLAKNDPDFPTDGPAKVGAVGAEGPYAETIQGGLKAYCDAHPDKYDWVNGFRLSFDAYDFSTQVEALKDCDYIMPPSTGTDIPGFMKQYRSAGGKGRYLGTAAQMAYLDLLVKGAGYDMMDNMVFALAYTWWNEEGEMVDLAAQFLEDYHSEAEATELKNSGGAYRGGCLQWYGVLDIIAKAANDVGPQNFTTQAIYDHAVGYTRSYDGNVWEYSADANAMPAEQRSCWESLGIFEMDKEIESLSRISDGWTPLLLTPQ